MIVFSELTPPLLQDQSLFFLNYIFNTIHSNDEKVNANASVRASRNSYVFL